MFLSTTSGIQRKKKNFIQLLLRLTLKVNLMRVLVIIGLLVVPFVHIQRSSG